MKTTFTLCLLAFFTLPCFGQWDWIEPGVVVDRFHDVHCISNSEIIVVGTEGTILKSSDGGDSWQQKNSGTDEMLWQVEFPTSEIGYITGGGGVVLKTLDGGETWNSVITGQKGGFYGYELSCVDEDLIFISSSSGLLKSVDGGENWVSLGNPPISREIQFLSEEVGFAGTYLWEQSDWLNPEFYKTSDGGNTWETLSGLAPFHFLSEDVGYYYLGGLKKTMDGGKSFENLSFHANNEEFSFSDLRVVNENTVWGIVYLALLDFDTSSRGIVKISSDGSGEFSEVIFPDNNPEFNLTSLDFADENLGFAVGSNSGRGIIWRNGGGENYMSTEEENSLEFKIYPNPTKGEINISVKDLKGDFQIVISDMTGKKVYSETFVNQNQIKINTELYTKGIYVVSILKDKKMRTQKIVVN